VGPNTCVDRGVVLDKMAYPIGGGEVASPCAEAFRDFRWIPKQGEDGATYRVCFVARDAAGFCAGPYDHVVSDYGPRSTSGGYYSRPHCVDIQVESADTTWHPETVATSGGANKVEHVGCLVEYAVKAGGSGKYNTLVSLAPSVTPPPGMRLLTLSGGSSHSALLQWTPARGMEGSAFSVCVEASPQGWGGGVWGAPPPYGNPRLTNGEPRLPTRCIHIKIRRCKYCVNPSDSLLTLIKDISPDINWLRLWAANGNDDNDDRTLTVTDPDMLALSSQQQVVNVGPVYRAADGDTLMTIAARFRTTVKSLLLLNPDVDGAGVLRQKQELCLIPCAA